MLKETKNNLIEKIAGKINQGEIKTKPRKYFVLKAAIFAFMNATTFLVATFLASFCAFALHLAGSSLLLFILIATAIFFLGINIALAEKITFFYTKPLFYNILLFLFFAFLAVAIILKTPLHNNILQYTKQNDVPIISPLYRCGCGCGCQKNGICSPTK
ncbi:hypothetical protein FJ208_02420 [Candidatus Gribaldobacteria bacterium]|nr:hypothetical protein [Candidatus Gribaldobacteria bacterium]